MQLRLKRMAVGLVIGALGSCASHQYSARSYRDVDTSIAYATICHNGKRTIRIPSSEWEEHKAHYDYRGPCRARGVPTRAPKRKPTHTVAEYENRKARAKWSEEEYQRHLRAQEREAIPAEDEKPPR